jgi:hypothetical protein
MEETDRKKLYIQRLLYNKSGFCMYYFINVHLIIIPLAGKVINLFICVKKKKKERKKEGGKKLNVGRLL